MNIFIGGVYGVGKTYFCRKLSSALDIPHYSASQLIQHSTISKAVENVDSNQEKLISGLFEVNKTHSTVLLDGHFCIMSKNGISLIDYDVFSRLNISKIVVLEQSSEVISRRLKVRGGELFDKKILENLLDLERTQAQLVSFKIGAPILFVTSEDASLPMVISFLKN